MVSSMPMPFDYHRIARNYRLAAAGGVIAVTTLLMAVDIAAAQSGGPFANLGGAWTGVGQISFSDGRTERVRCRADYAVGAAGNQLEQSLRCASDSYNFELHSNAQSQGGRISGTWSESTRNLNGNLTGEASRGHIQVRAVSGNIAVGLTLVANGNQQSVTIQPEGGADITGASIKLTRRGDGSRASTSGAATR
jgi:hypothetical protein